MSDAGARRAPRGRAGFRAVLAAGGLVLALAACSPATSSATNGGSAPLASPPAASASAASHTAVGLVLSIDASSPVDVRSFQLRTDAGQVLTFEVVKGVDTGFRAGHLQEHRASGDQVQVTFHVEGGRNLVDRLSDAPAPSGSPAAGAPSPSGG